MSFAVEEVGIRRSERPVKLKRSYSPETTGNKIKKSAKNGSKKSTKISREIDSNRPSAGRPICCDRCKDPFVFNPARKLQKKSGHSSFPRHRIDPVSNQVLTLCNACSLSLSYQRKPRREKIMPTAFEKEKYLQEARTFANSLVEVLRDSDAQRLFCPEFKSTPCACLQKFVLSDGNVEDSQKRAFLLLQLLKEAKRLSQQKCYSLEQAQIGNSGKGHKSRNIGLGNGQKRSQEFEMFVLEQRRYLRDELRLCERATQRVLMYSNNFLHKKLKTEPQRRSRIQRKKGKSAMGMLKPIAEMATETCCIDNCVLMALTHSALLHQWRERAASGQAEARRVLAEMLTPCGGGRTNCYKFISIVTGCSHSTISKVNEQMKRTGGEREPPEHGLKKWWQEQAKQNVPPNRKSESDSLYIPGSPDSSDLDAVCSIALAEDVDDSLVSEETLHTQLRSRDHITELQSHVMELQQESLLGDPLFSVNGNTQMVLKLNGGSSQLRSILRLRKNSSLMTDDSDEVLLGANVSELSGNLFLSPAAFSLLSSESCQDKGVDTNSAHQQSVSHLVLDDVTAENLMSSGLVINLLPPKIIQDGADGRHSVAVDDTGNPLIGDVTLLQSRVEGSNFLCPVAGSHKGSSSEH